MAGSLKHLSPHADFFLPNPILLFLNLITNVRN